MSNGLETLGGTPTVAPIINSTRASFVAFSGILTSLHVPLSSFKISAAPKGTLCTVVSTVDLEHNFS